MVLKIVYFFIGDHDNIYIRDTLRTLRIFLYETFNDRILGYGKFNVIYIDYRIYNDLLFYN